MWLIWTLACTGEPDKDPTGPTVELGEERRCTSPAATPALIASTLPGLHDASQQNMPIQYGGGGAAVADFNGDGLLDLFLPNAGEDQLYFGTASGNFVEQVAAWPAQEDASVGAVPVDVDADGDLDIFVTNMRGPNRLLANEGGIFTDITATAGVGGGDYDSIAASFADLDLDGDLDLFVANHRDEADLGQGLLDGRLLPGHPSELYRNNGDGTFTDISDQLPADLQEYGYPFMGVWQDFNGDAYPELYIINDFGAITVPNQLLRNEKGTLVPWEEPGLNTSMFAMGVAVGDYNSDGRADVAISDWGRMFLYEDAGDGSFYDAGQAAGLSIGAGRAQSWGVELADMDNDGDLDLPVAFGPLIMPPEYETLYEEELSLSNPHNQPDALFVQENGQLQDLGAAWGLDQTGNSRGFVLADINRDGRLDILKRFVDQPASLHLSDCTEAAWLELELRQDGRNPRAIGAELRLEAGGKTQLRWLRAGGTGFAVGHPPELHFGLGAADHVDRITVRWPDGQESMVEHIPGNRRITIRR